jgi:hypothetical protein
MTPRKSGCLSFFVNAANALTWLKESMHSSKIVPVDRFFLLLVLITARTGTEVPADFSRHGDRRVPVVEIKSCRLPAVDVSSRGKPEGLQSATTTTTTTSTATPYARVRVPGSEKAMGHHRPQQIKGDESVRLRK